MPGGERSGQFSQGKPESSFGSRKIFRWNATISQLTPDQPQIEINHPPPPSKILWIRYPEDLSSTPDIMSPDYVPHKEEMYIGPLEDLQDAWQKREKDPVISAWLEGQEEKRSPAGDGRTVLVTAVIINDKKVEYSFSANYRFGNNYLYPLEES